MFLKVIAITIIGYEIVYVVVKWTFVIRVSPKPLILLGGPRTCAFTVVLMPSSILNVVYSLDAYVLWHSMILLYKDLMTRSKNSE